jgi:hypothetical protein
LDPLVGPSPHARRWVRSRQNEIGDLA